MVYHLPVYPLVSVNMAVLIPSEKEVPNPFTCPAPLLKCHDFSSQHDPNLITQVPGAKFDPLKGQKWLGVLPAWSCWPQVTESLIWAQGTEPEDLHSVLT